MHELLAAFAAPAVAPAGISGSAISGAIGAALLVKVARLSERKLPEGPERAKAVMLADKIGRLSIMLEDVVDQDAAAYTKLVSVKSAHAKGLESDETLERAMKTVTLIPGAMGRAAMICINLAVELAEIAHPPALSDVAMGALLCNAAAEASLIAVKHNLDEISDESFCSKILSKLDFFDGRDAKLERIARTTRARRQTPQAVGGRNGHKGQPS
ncbi:MAG: cyclodeaminase/cyclohydrolase family protein [Chloroflexi bacterium]|nr:cyclodeaminase/cyclohydrolase family protein [Chloroflexota bacterium]